MFVRIFSCEFYFLSFSVYNICHSCSALVFMILIYYIFKCYLAAPQPTLGPYRGDRLTNPMIIIAFLLFWPEGHQDPRNEVMFLSWAERLVGFNGEPSDSNCNALTR